ncbi:MAG: hypothetical protein AB2L11_01725 [Syntrophobacteraceae bacterium]
MIAIHERNNSFSDRWIEYCKERQLEYLPINIFASDLMRQLRSAEVSKLLYHMPLFDLKTRLASRAIGLSVELGGIDVFPNMLTSWHFDDKIAQKYLFEALDIPHCATWVFYDLESALEWISLAYFPKVFKLLCGAGSANVQLVRTRSHAVDLIMRMFGDGIKATNRVLDDLQTKIYKHHSHGDWIAMIKRIPATVRNLSRLRKGIVPERGYVYFQDFLQGNEFDTRVTVIGNRAFAFRRFVRPNDFRASGSGRIDWEPTGVDLHCVQAAFEASSKIGSQCLAFDFAYNGDGFAVVLEVCYAFIPEAVYRCPGHWDQELNWHEGHMWPQDAIMEDLLATTKGFSMQFVQ